ncbi:MAG: DNA replication/repair protein RecF [Reichenbachiella sp.]
MFLQSLQLKNFKNYTEGSADFCEHINCLVGLNGSGKTNVLDAIHYLSLTKSHFNSVDAQNIRSKQEYFVVNGKINKENQLSDIHCSLKKGEKKLFTVDRQEYDKLSQHMGKFPIVLIAPNDDDLIRDSNETRRKFFDSIISQTDRAYLDALIKYNHYLKQRNALLKSFADKGNVDNTLLESYDLQIIEGAKFIALKRKDFVTNFQPSFEENYSLIAEKKETVLNEYKSKALFNDFETQFRKSKDKDLITQRTNVGVHRDEYNFEINGQPLKKFGSQGQQKSFLVSLKLAQFAFIQKSLGLTPILLLDDIFDKLDDGRIQKLLEIITSNQFKQIFITDAREERTMQLINKKYDPIRIFRIENNQLEQI